MGEEEDNVITIAFAAVDGRQQDNKERSWEDIFVGRRSLGWKIWRDYQ